MGRQGVSCRNRMLYAVASCGYIKKNYLVAMAQDSSLAYRELNTIIIRGWISEVTTYEKVNSRKRRLKYYAITKEGLQHLAMLANKFPEEAQWIRVLEKETQNLRLNKEKELFQRDRMLRFLSISSASTFAAQAGCEVKAPTIADSESEISDDLILSAEEREEVERFSDEETAELSEINSKDIIRKTRMELLRLIFENEGQEQNNNGIIYNPTSDLKFLSASEVKRSTASLRKEGEPFREGRYTGLLVSPFHSVLLYEGKQSGMAWSRWIIEGDLRSYRSYVRLMSSMSLEKLERPEGAILVKNAKMFEDLFLDKRGKHKSGEYFGNGFSAFYVFPVSSVGAKHLNEFLTTDITKRKNMVMVSALASGLFTENDDAYAADFPVLNQNGIQMAIGTFIDAIQLHRIINIQKQLNKPVGILCYEWQKNYYCRVLPEDTQFMTLR